MRYRVLLVQDDPKLLRSLARSLGCELPAIQVSEDLNGLIRIGSAMRVSERYPDSARSFAEYRFGEVSVDFLSGTVMRNGSEIGLSMTERRLLCHLIMRREEVLSREELLSQVWGYRATNTRTLDVHIASLRRKLEYVPSDPQYILTVRGKGYTFHENDTSQLNC